jgi:glycosyltransferase involved in cell wall biosynthesis
MTWVCQDQQTGLLIAPENSQDIKEKIIQLQVNKKQGQQMGQKGLERLQKEFDIKQVTQKILQLYQQFIDPLN